MEQTGGALRSNHFIYITIIRFILRDDGARIEFPIRRLEGKLGSRPFDPPICQRVREFRFAAQTIRINFNASYRPNTRRDRGRIVSLSIDIPVASNTKIAVVGERNFFIEFPALYLVSNRHYGHRPLVRDGEMSGPDSENHSNCIYEF